MSAKFRGIVILGLLVLGLTGSPVAAIILPVPGVLLVASSSMGDVRFRQTVILLVRHDAAGTIGLILNRPSGLQVGQVFRNPLQLQRLKQPLYVGGPLGRQRLAVLWGGGDVPQGAEALGNGFAVSGPGTLISLLQRFGRQTRPFKVIAGYCGWAPGQLTRELRRGDWSLARASAETLFSLAPDQLWRRFNPPPGTELI